MHDEHRPDAGAETQHDAIPREREGAIVDRVAGHMAEVMRELHMDLEDPNFEGTPKRVDDTGE